MGTRYGRAAFLPLILAAFLFPGAGRANAQAVILGSGDWKPLVDPTAPDFGPLGRVVMEACAAAHLRAEIQLYPWTRCEQLVEAGALAAAFPYAKTADREARLGFSSEPLVRTFVRIFYVQGRGRDVPWSSWKDFGTAVFASVPGYWYVEQLAKSGLPVETAQSDVLAFRMLRAGRVAYVIDDELIAWPIIRETFGAEADAVKTVTRPALETNLYMIVSRTDPHAAATAARIDQGLRAIKANGLYEKIMKGIPGA